jgi:AcrR family transcriptional regulator
VQRDQPAPSKRERTRERIAGCALELFDRRGFEATTVAQVAAAAGVTEMTVFRHFPAKELLVLEDPYDPYIVAGIAGQPLELGPLARTVHGLRRAWSALPEPSSATVRRRVRIVADSETLRAAMWRVNATTERLIVEQLVGDGAEVLAARVAASAVLAALTAALFEWAHDDDAVLADVLTTALETLEGDRG